MVGARRRRCAIQKNISVNFLNGVYTMTELKLDRSVLASPQTKMTRRQINTMLLLAAFAAPHSMAIARTQLGEPAYLVRDFDWVDYVRSRSVPARLYWPTMTLSSQSVPLVVFSHGIGGSREGYSYLGKYWSSRGVASLHVQHIGSDAALWRGNPLGVVGRLHAAAQETEAMARVADLRFALDRVLSDKTKSGGVVVNHKRIVVAGHSYGANTALLAAGAQVVRGGQIIECADARFSAAIIISAPPFYGESDLKTVLSQVKVPTLHVTATDDVIDIPGLRSGVEDRLALFDAITHPRKLLAVFHGGSHSMFTDRSFTGGLLLNPKVKAATADLTLAFFDYIFEGNGSLLVQWQTKWHSILAQKHNLDAA